MKNVKMKNVKTTGRQSAGRQSAGLFLLFFVLVVSLRAQPALRLTNLRTRKVTVIREGNNAQVIFQLPGSEEFRFTAKVEKILDSAILFSNRRLIPLASLRCIDRLSWLRILPPLVLTSLASVLVHDFSNPINPERGDVWWMGGSTAVSFSYLALFNHRKLRRNRVDDTIHLEVVRN
ncbi:MAG: hypothetical protein H7Z75_07880 [Ferruginibacter sp.]|nr:hypothetical protein [Cytophagales bacterium]